MNKVRIVFLAGISAIAVGLPLAGASAADLAPAPYYKAPPPPAAVWSWTGFYLGINGGYSFGHDSFNQSITGFPGPSAILSSGTLNVAPDGGLFGGQIGYNWQTGHFVLGVEGDGDWAHQTDTACGVLCLGVVGAPGGFIAATTTVQQTINWIATARARVGWAEDRWLAYFTGGAAWGGINETDTFTLNAGPAGGGGSVASGFSQTRNGWTVGAGMEVRLWGNWSGKLEYLHIDLGSATDALTIPGAIAANPTPLTLTTTSSFRDEIVRGGLNYKF